MITKGQIHEKLAFEMEDKAYSIRTTAQQVKEHALRIKGELEEVIRLADQVMEQTEDAIHFPVEPWRGSSWMGLPVEIVKLDTMLKAYRSMKRVIQLSNELHEEEK